MGDFGQFFGRGKLVVHYDQVVAFGLNPRACRARRKNMGER